VETIDHFAGSRVEVASCQGRDEDWCAAYGRDLLSECDEIGLVLSKRDVCCGFLVVVSELWILSQKSILGDEREGVFT
jgi:hypothetical protein